MALRRLTSRRTAQWRYQKPEDIVWAKLPPRLTEPPIIESIEGNTMLDLLYVGLIVALFIATLGLVRLFEVLMEASK